MTTRLPETQYLQLLDECLADGIFRNGRNGGTHGLFGRQIRFDLSKGFPLLTTKKVNFYAVVVELLWFLRGDTNVQFLHEHGVKIWDEWANENGDLGPVYGKQWRKWRGDGFDDYVDQIQIVVEGLKTDPYSRRHIVSAWNVADLPRMALPPCHCLFQFHVANRRLSCQLYQRSADIFLGVPFNIASYALLTHLIAREVGLEVGEFVHTFGDVHLYDNHVEQAALQLERAPRPFPTLEYGSTSDMFNLKPADIMLLDYNPHPAIAALVSA
jgi:thymidylate synthase